MNIWFIRLISFLIVMSLNLILITIDSITINEYLLIFFETYCFTSIIYLIKDYFDERR
jgi:hypothetical protein